MTDTAKLYVETVNGLIDSDSLASTAAVLTKLALDQNDITFTGDENGHYFAIPAELMDAFRKEVGDGDEPEAVKPKRGRPRKVVPVETEETEAEEDPTEDPEQE
jgi:hypothetical protein